MDNNYLQVFSFEGKKTRTIIDEKGIVWFVAKDIADALGYADTSNPSRLFAHVPEIWTGVKRIHITSDKATARPYQEMLCLIEQGVYFFLGRSDKKKAIRYQMWIAGEVVPSIRKFGIYATPAAMEKLINDPDFIIRLVQEIKKERTKSAELQKKNLALQDKIQKDKPKVLFAEAVETSKDCILIGNLAKILKQNGIEIGQNRLFAWMRENGFLMKPNGERWNMPTQLSLEKGLLVVKKTVVNNPDGSTRIFHTPKVTSSGQLFFVNLFLKNKEN